MTDQEEYDLRAENERLRYENARLWQALGRPAQTLVYLMHKEFDANSRKKEQHV